MQANSQSCKMSDKDIIPGQTSISVIVAVTEVQEERLDRCLASLAGQTLKNIEAILVMATANGGLTKLCKDFAKRDSRFKVIDFENENLSELLNSALDNAHGGYIGFVNPADWSEKEMYEELNALACSHRPSVVTSFYYSDTESGSEISRYHDDVFLSGTKITDKYRIKDFYLCPEYFWSSIYSREFLKKNAIRFFEGSSTDSCFLGFAFLVYCHLSSVFVYRAAFYHYNRTDPRITKDPFEISLDILNGHAAIQKFIEHKKPNEKTVQIEITKVFRDVKAAFKDNCQTLKQRSQFLQPASRLLTPYLSLLKPNEHLTKSEKSLFRKFALHPALTACTDRNNGYMKALRFIMDIQVQSKVSHLKLFGFPILFRKKTDDYYTFNLCRIPLKRIKKQRGFRGSGIKSKYYYCWLPLVKRIDTTEEIKVYFLNIRVRKKMNLQARLDTIQRSIKSIPSAEDIFYFTNMSLTVRDAHKNTFPQFKDINKGKSIAILGSGPSLNYAPEIKDSLTIACNRTIDFLKDRDPTYYFIVDNTAALDYFDKITKLRSQVFLGRYLHKSLHETLSISEELRNQENVFTFYSNVGFYSYTIRPEIETNPLADFRTIVHCALHFALYTNPDTIYLIGCDTSLGGYAQKHQVQAILGINEMLYGYKKFKVFRDLHYPDTKIISVNPVGLRGIYDDVYTGEFAEKDAELDLSEIEIVDRI